MSKESKYNFSFRYVLNGIENGSVLFRFRIYLAERINSVLIPKKLGAYPREQVAGLIKHGRRIK